MEYNKVSKTIAVNYYYTVARRSLTTQLHGLVDMPKYILINLNISMDMAPKLLNSIMNCNECKSAEFIRHASNFNTIQLNCAVFLFIDNTSFLQILALEIRGK